MKKLLTLILLITYSLGAMEFKETGQQIRLLCGDSKEVVTSLDLMKKESGAVCMMLEDIDPAKYAIPVPNVDSKTLRSIINCLEYPETLKHTISLLKPYELSDFIDAIGYLKMNQLIQKLHTQKPDFVTFLCKEEKTTKRDLFTDLGFRKPNVTLPRALSEKSGTIRDLLETHETLARVIPTSISSGTVATIFNCLEHPENAERIIASLKDQKLLDFTQAILYLDIPELFEKLQAIQWTLRLPSHAINLCKASGFATSRDQKVIVTHNGRYAHIRDIQSGNILQTLTHPDIVREIFLSRDKQWIITNCYDNIVRIWDAQSGNILQTLPHPDDVWDILLSHGNQRIITGCRGNIVRIWDTQSGNILQTLPHPDYVWDILLSHDNQRIITGCRDHIVRIWDAQSGNILQTLPHPDIVREIILSHDNKLVITSCDDKMVRIWNTQSGNILQTLSHPRIAWEIILSHDKQRIITRCGDKMVRIWDTQSGNILQTLSHPDTVIEILLSYDNQWIITNCDDKMIRIWDTQTGNILQTLSHPNNVKEIKLSHDEQWIITSCYDNMVRIWDAQSGNILQTFSHPDIERKTLVSHDKQQIITNCDDNIVRIWPLIGIETLRSLHFNHLLLITKIYEQSMKGIKLDLTAAGSDELRSIFESLPIHLQNALNRFVILPRTSLWGYLKTAVKFFASKGQPKK